jgi:Putative metallopeptidase
MGCRWRTRGRVGRAARLAALLCAFVLTAPAVNAQPAKADRIAVVYEEPTNPAHKPLYTMLKEQRALERVRELLVPVRWPRTLRLQLKSCDESNAWYEDAVVTVCYEYLEDMWRSANASKRPAFIKREDAFIGPLVDTFLHEAGHATFDLLKIPLLGREEDAADAIAAYYVLQFPAEKKRRLILGSAFAYAAELRVRKARDLTRRRFDVGRHVTFADEHGTPAQRLYNLLCIAYGSDKVLFADVVEKGYLPNSRAEMCEDEYRQIDYAYRTLIAPHVDGATTALTVAPAPPMAARVPTKHAARKAPARHRVRRRRERAVANMRARGRVAFEAKRRVRAMRWQVR